MGEKKRKLPDSSNAGGRDGGFAGRSAATHKMPITFSSAAGSLLTKKKEAVLASLKYEENEKKKN